MKVTDWKAIVDDVAERVGVGLVTETFLEVSIAKHTREVPEGLATRLAKALGALRPEPGDCWIERCGCKHCIAVGEFDKAGGYDVLKDATPEACAALDADAEAMRVRQAVDVFLVRLEFKPHRHIGVMEIGTSRFDSEWVSGASIPAIYIAAHEALRKAGKL